MCPLHFHETYALSIFHTHAVIRLRDEQWRVRPGTVVVLEPYEVHGGEPDSGGCPQDGFFVAPRFLEEQFGHPEPFALRQPVIDDPQLAAALLDGMARAGAGDATALAAAVRTVFTSYGTSVDGETGIRSRRELAAQVAALLDHPIAALGAAAGLSRSHYSRRFRRLMGISPLGCRRTLRVEVARALIERGVPLSVAATRAGFADQAHMTRQVRSNLGIAPSAFRPTTARRSPAAARSRCRSYGA